MLPHWRWLEIERLVSFRNTGVFIFIYVVFMYLVRAISVGYCTDVKHEFVVVAADISRNSSNRSRLWIRHRSRECRRTSCDSSKSRGVRVGKTPREHWRQPPRQWWRARWWKRFQRLTIRLMRSRAFSHLSGLTPHYRSPQLRTHRVQTTDHTRWCYMPVPCACMDERQQLGL